MCLQKNRLLIAVFSVLLCVGISLSGCEISQAHGSDIPIEGAIYHVHRPDNSFKTYIDIVIGKDFAGKLPEDIDSITVTGPNGDLPISKDDFTYNPLWRAFWIVIPGSPAIGTYTFKVTSSNKSGSTTDTQCVLRTIPIPDTRMFKPARGETLACKSPTFSWSVVDAGIPLYYQVQVQDMKSKDIYRTSYVEDMLSIRLPPDLLKAGQTYRWRVRVADGSDWIEMNNRSHSPWLTFSVNQTQSQCEYKYNVPAKFDDGWETSSLSEEGVDSEKIDEMILEILNGKYKDTHSVLLVKNGKLILEEYFSGYNRNSKHVMASATKSIASILVGIAIDRRMIPNIDLKIYELFPEYRGTKWIDEKYDITLKHLLTMTAGLDWIAAGSGVPLTDPRNDDAGLYRSSNPITYTLDKNLIESPGKRYNYSTGVSTLLGEVLRKTSGLSADQFAEKYLLDPLGITDHRWKFYPDGTVDTGGGLFLRPRDMAKIGYMMLKNGKWKGKQIVSEEWVSESTKAHVQQTGTIILPSDYGYQWHHGKRRISNQSIETFFASGLGGQYIFILPTLDLVVVFTSKHKDSSGIIYSQLMLANYIIPAVLRPAPPPKTIKLNQKIVDKYLGYYGSKEINEKLTVLKEGETLYIQHWNGEKGRLFPETESIFYITSKELGNLQFTFIRDKKGEIRYFIVSLGFLGFRFDKIK